MVFIIHTSQVVLCSNFIEGSIFWTPNAKIGVQQSQSWEQLFSFSLNCSDILWNFIFVKIFFFQCLKKVSKFIAEQNERVYEPRGLKLTDPSSRGLRVIEISCLDRPPNAWLTLSHSTQEFFMWNQLEGPIVMWKMQKSSQKIMIIISLHKFCF